MSVLPSLLLLIALPQFTYPALKGNPFPTDGAVIPEAYLGEWASRESVCGNAAATPASFLIERKKVNGKPVEAVWAYSDHPAILVFLAADEQDKGQNLYPDISCGSIAMRSMPVSKIC
jgi:hypothetical protein